MNTRALPSKWLLIWTIGILVSAWPLTLAAEQTTYIQYNPFAEPGPSQETLSQPVPLRNENPKVTEELAQARLEGLVRQTDMLSNVLSGLQQTLEAQKDRELELGRQSYALSLKTLEIGKQANATSLKVIASAIGAIMLILFLSYWMQLRSFNRILSSPAMVSVGQGVTPNLLNSPAGLLEAIQTLEARIEKLRLPHTSSNPEEPVNALNTGSVGPSLAIAQKSADSASKISMLLEKARVAMDAERYTEAVKCYSDVLALDPLNSSAHLKKGIALERLNQLEESLECFERAVSIDANASEAEENRERVITAIQQNEKAPFVYENNLHHPKKEKGQFIDLAYLEKMATES
jgi:tetratricopeptide (TPR) repeat protein